MLSSPDSLVSAASSSQCRDASPYRSRTIPTSKTFPRLDSSSSSVINELGTDATYEAPVSEFAAGDKAVPSSKDVSSQVNEDIFGNEHLLIDEKDGQSTNGTAGPHEMMVEGTDDLPVELLSLSDRYGTSSVQLSP